MLNHLSTPETRDLSILGPAQAEEIENYLFLEECESKARSLGDLDWADLNSHFIPPYSPPGGHQEFAGGFRTSRSHPPPRSRPALRGRARRP